MMKTPIGKIARLPRKIRDELNLRLENGEPAGSILPWLNALPEVKAILADRFASSPVSQQNLTNWRQGGYQQWREDRQHHDLVRALVQHAGEITDLPGAPGFARQLSTLFLAELAVSNHKAQTVPADPEQQFKRLRMLLHAVGRVRREDCLTDRLALDRERQAFQLERKFPNGAARETTSRQWLRLLSELDSAPSDTVAPSHDRDLWQKQA
jgi:hypothetical protein